MKSTIIEEHDLKNREAHLLENRILSRIKKDFQIYPGLSQEHALRELNPIISELTEKLGQSILGCACDCSKIKLPLGIWGDSRMARLQRNLDESIDLKLLNKIKQVTRFFCESKNSKPPFIWINKDSNGGYDHWTTAPKHKIRCFREGLEMVTSNENLPGKGDIGFRVTADSVSRGNDNKVQAKKRKWFYTYQNAQDILEMYNINLYDFPGVTEFEGHVGGEDIITVEMPFISPARCRQIIAVDGFTNSIAQVMAQTLFKQQNVSESLYKLTSKQMLLDFVKGYYVSCIDFENFDKTVVYVMIKSIFEEMSDVFPILSSIFENMFNSYINMDVNGIDLIPKENNRYQKVFYNLKSDPHGIFGIISGYGLTHIFGKIIGTAFVAWAYEETIHPVNTISEYEDIMMNGGDDNVMRFKNEDDMEKFNSFVLEQDMMRVTLEDPMKFLGNQIWVKDKKGESVSSSPYSFVINSLCPEREAGHSQRRFATYGLEQRFLEFRETAPNLEILDLITKFYNDLTNLIPDFEEVKETEKAYAHSDKELQKVLDQLGIKKIEELYYNVDPDDLTKEQLELFSILEPIESVLDRVPALDEVLK